MVAAWVAVRVSVFLAVTLAPGTAVLVESTARPWVATFVAASLIEARALGMVAPEKFLTVPGIVATATWDKPRIGTRKLNAKIASEVRAHSNVLAVIRIP